ncbi:MAG: hypothetical protein FAF03_02425 [Epsilonproteobacteria bacterium]|nr:hypothetical protein [Campylobacterota bacterium]
MYEYEDMETYNALSKGRKMEIHYENIISIFNQEEHVHGLTLSDLHLELKNQYGLALYFDI